MSARNTVTPDGPSAVNGRGHILVTAAELIESWVSRDAQYINRARALTDDEIAVIRQSRIAEAGYIEPRLRGLLAYRARRWRPPTPGEWS